MASKYFTVAVKPTVTASLQHTAAFGSGEVLFDWTSFQVPRGANKLVSATAMVRAKGDATPTANPFGLQLLFSSTNTVSLGTINSAVANRPSDDFLGFVEFAVASYTAASVVSTALACLPHGDDATNFAPLILEGNIGTGDNVGYDTIYIGGVTQGAFDWSGSLNAIAEDGAAEAASTQAITMDGTGMDVREHFIAGDVLHIGTSVGSPAADSVIGTVESVSDATTGPINLTAVSETALVDGDILYNIHPVKLVLQFER